MIKASIVHEANRMVRFVVSTQCTPTYNHGKHKFLVVPSSLAYASSEILYFSTREVSSSQPPDVTDDGSRSMTCTRKLTYKNAWSSL